MDLAEPVDRRSFLGLLDPADREVLLSLGERRTFPAGTRPIVQGDDSDTVFVVVSGLVKVTVDTPDGREVVLALLGPGDLLGEFEVIEGGATGRMASNVAVQELDTVVVAGERFMAAVASHPAMALTLMRVLVGRLSAADRRREASASMDVGRSLASFLVELTDRYGTVGTSGIEVAFPLTQEDLAALISCSRDSAVRGLGTLRSRGLVRTMRRRVVVTDLDGLRRFAAGPGRAGRDLGEDVAMDRGPDFDGVRIGRPAVGGLVDAGLVRIDDLPEDLDELSRVHGVGPKAIRLLREARDARRG